MNDPAAQLNATATATPTGIIAPAAPAASTPPATATTAPPGTAGTMGTTATGQPTYGMAGVKGAQFANYNGQGVMVGDSVKQGFQESADKYNALTGAHLSAMDYDKMANPDSYGARWGVADPAASAVPSVSAPAYAPASLGNPTGWNVTGEQTVAGQIKQLLDANSPIIQQARAMGLAGANDRGLLNSSIGESAGLDAAYKAALPIATSDAGTFARAAGYNADETNQFAVHNMDAKNDAFKATLSAQTQTAIANLQAQTQTNLGYLDATTKTTLANLSNENQLKLASVEAQYHTIMQSNASASDLFRQVTQNIATISASKDMDAAAKQQAVDNQLQMLKNGMQINGAISNLDLGALLNFTATPFPGSDLSAPVTVPGMDYGADRGG
jgi:hypothetical protein